MPLWFHQHSRVPPSAHAYPIHDRLAEPFWIVVADAPPYDYLQVVHDITRARVGHLFFARPAPATITILDAWVVRHQRGRGLGGALLQQLIALAAGWGVEQITAEVHPSDLELFPTLVVKLQQRGFVVLHQTPELTTVALAVRTPAPGGP